MNVKKCDRCGKYYEFYKREQRNSDSKKIKQLLEISRNGLKLMYNELYSSDTIDLCPECFEELLQWLDNKQFTGNL